MAKVTRAESEKVGKLSKELREYLEYLDAKYLNNEATQSADLYSDDYSQLLSLDGELVWWVG